MDSRPGPNKKGRPGGKKKQPPPIVDIVYTTWNGSIQTIPSLEKKLQSVTETVVGLQYVWEYRSPSRSTPPHYQCKLCKVQRLQKEISTHIMGWKHSFRYLKQVHPDKVPFEEEDAATDVNYKKAVKTAAAEVQQAEGRGQVKIVLKEPSDVPAFHGMKSAQRAPRGNTGMMGPGPRMSQQEFMGHGGMRRGPADMGGFSSPGRYGNNMSGADRGMMERERMQNFSDDMHMATEGFGNGRRSEGMGRPFRDDMPMNSREDRMMGPGDSIPATLLKYLDDFRIENEDDAQIVLKVTQKLTDVLMEYRLRSISTKPMPTSSFSNMSYSSSRGPHGSNDRFSGGMPGSSRYFN
ncbi:uncharacterized protein [Paramisgurnus dabryanus]|uniref:uncharacterized protein n=1 Tax=Paramisgurnus dabryanus TaxID=90735 RepID=UPI0031F3509A